MLFTFNPLPHNPDLTPLEKKAFENIVGKGENAGNQHFLLFPTMFSTLPNTTFNFWVRKCFRLQMR